MELLNGFLRVYLDDARQQLDDLNRRFAGEVGYSSRPFAEDVLGAFSASINVIQMVEEELSELGPGAGTAPFNDAVVSLLSGTGEIEFVSASITTALGYERAELVGRPTFELVHPEDLPQVQSDFDAAAADGRRVADLRYRYRHKDGTWRRVTTHLQCIRHPRHPGLVAHSVVAPQPVA